MNTERKLRPCPCGGKAVWFREPPDPERASEHAVCFLTEADFADDYCDACFDRFCAEEAMMLPERAAWKRIPETTHG